MRGVSVLFKTLVGAVVGGVSKSFRG